MTEKGKIIINLVFTIIGLLILLLTNWSKIGWALGQTFIVVGAGFNISNVLSRFEIPKQKFHIVGSLLFGFLFINSNYIPAGMIGVLFLIVSSALFIDLILPTKNNQSV